MAGISIWQLLIIALIVVLLFGTKKLRGMGSDLGAAVKGFKKAVADDEPQTPNTTQQTDAEFRPSATATPPSLQESKPSNEPPKP